MSCLWWPHHCFPLYHLPCQHHCITSSKTDTEEAQLHHRPLWTSLYFSLCLDTPGCFNYSIKCAWNLLAVTLCAGPPGIQLHRQLFDLQRNTHLPPLQQLAERQREKRWSDYGGYVCEENTKQAPWWTWEVNHIKKNLNINTDTTSSSPQDDNCDTQTASSQHWRSGGGGNVAGECLALLFLIKHRTLREVCQSLNTHTHMFTWCIHRVQAQYWNTVF